MPREPSGHNRDSLPPYAFVCVRTIRSWLIIVPQHAIRARSLQVPIISAEHILVPLYTKQSCAIWLCVVETAVEHLLICCARDLDLHRRSGYLLISPSPLSQQKLWSCVSYRTGGHWLGITASCRIYRHRKLPICFRSISRRKL